VGKGAFACKWWIIIGFLVLFKIVTASGAISVSRLFGRISIVPDLSPGLELAVADQSARGTSYDNASGKNL
jgi:hypothetical protein